MYYCYVLLLCFVMYYCYVLLCFIVMYYSKDTLIGVYVAALNMYHIFRCLEL